MSLSIISPHLKPFSIEEAKEHYVELYKRIRIIYVSISDIFHYFDEEYEIRFYNHIYPVHRVFRLSFKSTDDFAKKSLDTSANHRFAKKDDKRPIKMDISFMVISIIFSNEICLIEKTFPRTPNHLNILFRFVSRIIQIGMNHDDGYGRFNLDLEKYLEEEFPQYRKDQLNPILFHPSLSQNIRVFFLKNGVLRPERVSISSLLSVSLEPNGPSDTLPEGTPDNTPPISSSNEFDQMLRESSISFQKNPMFDLEAMKDRLKRLNDDNLRESAEILNLHEQYEENKIKMRRLLEIK